MCPFKATLYVLTHQIFVDLLIYMRKCRVGVKIKCERKHERKRGRFMISLLFRKRVLGFDQLWRLCALLMKQLVHFSCWENFQSITPVSPSSFLSRSMKRLSRHVSFDCIRRWRLVSCCFSVWKTMNPAGGNIALPEHTFRAFGSNTKQHKHKRSYGNAVMGHDWGYLAKLACMNLICVTAVGHRVTTLRILAGSGPKMVICSHLHPSTQSEWEMARFS